MTHQPKGSLCMHCRYAVSDCSHLSFADMPALSQHQGRVIVRCTEFVSNAVDGFGKRSAHRRAGGA